MKSIIRSIALLGTMSLAGCQTIDVLTFDKDDHSGIAGQARTHVSLIRKGSLGDEFKSLGPNFADILAPAQTYCEIDKRFRAESIGGAAAAWLADSIVKALFEALQARIEALKSASAQSYVAVNIFDDAKIFSQGPVPGKVSNCILLVRSTSPDKGQKTPTPTFVTLLGVIPRGAADQNGLYAAATLSPLYTKMTHSSAVTRDGKGVNVQLVMSIAAIVRGKDGPARQDVSLGSLSLGELKFGTAVPYFPLPVFSETSGQIPPQVLSPTTGLMALPRADAAALELRVAVSEAGSALPDFDKAKLEAKSLQDALGPEFKKKLLEVLKN